MPEHRCIPQLSDAFTDFPVYDAFDLRHKFCLQGAIRAPFFRERKLNMAAAMTSDTEKKSAASAHEPENRPPARDSWNFYIAVPKVYAPGLEPDYEHANRTEAHPDSGRR